MKIYKEMDLMEFEAWSGGSLTLSELTVDEINTLEVILEELYPEGIEEVQLNDILWFETEWISELIGRELFS